MMFHRLKRLLAGSLRRQLVVGMALVLALAMSLFVWDQTRRQQEVLRQQQTSQAVVLARTVATSGAVWVASRDYGGLQDIVDSLEQYPDLGYAIVLDASGQILAHTDQSRVKTYLADLPKTAEIKVFESEGNFADVASPVILAGIHMGWVRIGLGGDAIRAKLASAVFSGLLFTFGGIGLSCVLAFLAGRHMTRRLYAIQKVADAVEAGEAGLRVDITGDDEAARLARRFNNMLDALAQRTENLQRSQAEIRAIIKAIPDTILTIRKDGTLLGVHAARVDLFSGPPQTMVNRPLAQAMPASAAEDLMAATTQALATKVAEEINYSVAVADELRHFEACVVPAGDDTVISIVRDTTQRKNGEDQLRRAANVFTYAGEGIMITTADGTLIEVNHAFTSITGYEREEVLGKSLQLLDSGRHSKEFYAAILDGLREHGQWQGELWKRRKNGEIFAGMQNISVVRNAQGDITEYVALFSDITEIMLHQQQLERMAHYDTLTGLPNRVLLADRLQQDMAQSRRRGHKVLVAYLDLDGFKAVNDTYGHAIGDQVLISVTGHMKQALRDGDTLARIGGDEFVVILVDFDNAQPSLPMLERLLAAAAEPVVVGSVRLQVTASLGVTFYPQSHDVDGDQLVRQADQAMYTAKLAGRNRYHIFDAEHDFSLRGHFRDIERVRQALSEREFVLHYQPKVNMRRGTVVGAEALIRWRHPERGLLAPADFLPLVESDALAIDIGEWVIDTALTQIETWRIAGLDLAVSVNVGALQLQQDNFMDRLRAILATHPSVKASCLELEILETSALEDMAKVSELIASCAQLGLTFSLDDFGTGYSSLTYLRRLQVGLLKIDRSFVRNMLDDPDDLAILQGVIGLASAFRREVIAEGVESVAHGTLLLQMGCELAQGYGIARPMPAAEMPAWVATWRPDPAWSKLSLSADDT